MKKRIVCIVIAMLVGVAFYETSSFIGTDGVIVTGTEKTGENSVLTLELDSVSDEKLDEDKTIDLGTFEDEVSFVNDVAIETLAEEYNLGDPDDIAEIVYVPIVCMEELTQIVSADAEDNRYYVKKEGSSEKKGSIIRSSWYEYPGGNMKIGNSLSRTYSFSAESGSSVDAEIVKAELKLKYGFSVTGSDYIEDTQKVTVKKGYKRNVKAYRNLIVYEYELWKDRIILSDKLCGTGKVSRPIGVIFTIGKNVKLD